MLSLKIKHTDVSSVRLLFYGSFASVCVCVLCFYLFITELILPYCQEIRKKILLATVRQWFSKCSKWQWMPVGERGEGIMEEKISKGGGEGLVVHLSEREE